MSTRNPTFEALRRRLRETEASCHVWGEPVSTGNPEFDQLLGHGWQPGTLVEWIGTPGCGATTLALILARSVYRSRTLAIVDRHRAFYPPAASASGIDLARTMIVQPTTARDYDWSLIQILRSSGISAVLTWPDNANQKMLRRWQLAAEHGGTLGLLIRPLDAVKDSSWARTRLLVEAQRTTGVARRWRITVLNSHALSHDTTLELEWNDETGQIQTTFPLPVASPLVHSEALLRSSGA